MNSQSLTFDEVNKDPFIDKIVRQSFRIPVDGTAWVTIETTRYPVRDICLDGVGITLENPSEFTISQTIKNCELTIGEHRIKGLDGQVVHFSLNSGEDWQCGIKWIAIDNESKQKMTEIFSELKAVLLKGDT